MNTLLFATQMRSKSNNLLLIVWILMLDLAASVPRYHKLRSIRFLFYEEFSHMEFSSTAYRKDVELIMGCLDLITLKQQQFLTKLLIYPLKVVNTNIHKYRRSYHIQPTKQGGSLCSSLFSAYKLFSISQILRGKSNTQCGLTS